MCVRKTQDQALNEFEEFNLILLEKYTNNKNKHEVQCKICDGKSQVSLSHLNRGNNSCSHCAGTYRMNPDEIYQMCLSYDIKILDEIVGIKSRYNAECLVCGYYFKTNPSLTKNRGYGCPKCAKKVLRTHDEVVKQVSDLGYTYVSGGESTFDELVVICDKGHEHRTHVHGLLNKGRMCSLCSKTGFSKDKPAILYYLRVESPVGPLYKIGITNRSVKERFPRSDLEKITILREIPFENGSDAFDLEQYYLNIFKDFKYNGQEVLKSGNTELFTRNLFGIF